MTNSLWDFIVSYCCFCFRVGILKISLLCPPDQTGETVFCSFVHVPVSFKIPFFFVFFSESSLVLISFKILTLNHLGWFLRFTRFCRQQKRNPKVPFSRTRQTRLCLGFWCPCSLWYWTCYFRSCAIVFPRSNNRKVIGHPKRDYANIV